MSRRIREFASPTILIYIVLLAHEMQKVEGVIRRLRRIDFLFAQADRTLANEKKAVQNLKGPEAALAFFPYSYCPRTKSWASYPA